MRIPKIMTSLVLNFLCLSGGKGWSPRLIPALALVCSVNVNIDYASTLPGTVLGTRVYTVNKTEKAKLCGVTAWQLQVGRSENGCFGVRPLDTAWASKTRVLSFLSCPGPALSGNRCQRQMTSLSHTVSAALKEPCCPWSMETWGSVSEHLSLVGVAASGDVGVSLSVGLNEEGRRLERQLKLRKISRN